MISTLPTNETMAAIAVSASAFIPLTGLCRGLFKAMETGSRTPVLLTHSSQPPLLCLPQEPLARSRPTRMLTTQLLHLEEELSLRTKEASSSRYVQDIVYPASFQQTDKHCRSIIISMPQSALITRIPWAISGTSMTFFSLTTSGKSSRRRRQLPYKLSLVCEDVPCPGLG